MENYTDYSKMTTPQVEDIEPEVELTEEIVETLEEEVETEEAVDTIAVEAAQLAVDAEEKTEQTKPETLKGIVTADKLNVRKVPSLNGEVAAAINKNTKVRINVEKSTLDWYKVSTSTGVSGYCMKKFIEVK